MKIIKCKLCTRVNHGTEEAPEWVNILGNKEIHCTADKLPANEEIAMREAYNGEYTVEDDGKPEPVTPDDDVDWDTMAEAIKEGVNEV